MKSVVEILKEFCDDNGYEFYENYSGRYMYGKTCVGIVGSFNTLHLVVCLADVLRDEGYDNAEDILGEPCQDTLGLETIVYFKGIQG